MRKLCTRKVDELGRIVLPQEARTALGILEKQNLDVYIEEDAIIIRKNCELPVCTLCGESENELIEVGHSLFCSDCISKIKDM